MALHAWRLPQQVDGYNEWRGRCNRQPQGRRGRYQESVCRADGDRPDPERLGPQRSDRRGGTASPILELSHDSPRLGFHRPFSGSVPLGFFQCRPNPLEWLPKIDRGRKHGQSGFDLSRPREISGMGAHDGGPKREGRAA